MLALLEALADAVKDGALGTAEADAEALALGLALALNEPLPVLGNVAGTDADAEGLTDTVSVAENMQTHGGHVGIGDGMICAPRGDEREEGVSKRSSS